MHQGGIATPLVVRWPGGIEAGTRTRQPGHIIDLLPTFLELAGEVESPEHLEGESLAPVLAGGARTSPPDWGWLWSGNRAYRRGDLKAAWDKKFKRWELYDLDKDPTEARDIAAERPELVEEFDALWKAWKKRTLAKG
jgi:arylsulfatase